MCCAGSERQQGDARFLCLVAEAGPGSNSLSGAGSESVAAANGTSSSRSSQATASDPGMPAAGADPAAAGAAAAGASGSRVAVRDFLTPAGAQADSVDLGPLMAALVRLAFPPAMRQDYGASYSAGGLRGAVVVDTFGDFVPPKRRRMPNGTIRWAAAPARAAAGRPASATMVHSNWHRTWALQRVARSSVHGGWWLGALRCLLLNPGGLPGAT